jgi:hypothetical protein
LRVRNAEVINMKYFKHKNRTIFFAVLFHISPFLFGDDQKSCLDDIRIAAKKISEINSPGVDCYPESRSIVYPDNRSNIPSSITQSAVYLNISCPGERPSACSGVIIDKNKILTAHHCISCLKASDSSKIKVKFGKNATSQVSVTAQGSIRPHPNSKDLAVVEIPSLPSGFKPAEILPSDSSYSKGSPFTIAGFGPSNKANPTYGDLNWGTQYYNVKRDKLSYKTGEKYKNLIELKNPGANKANSFPGDSGGPVFYKASGKYYLAGIISGGKSDTSREAVTVMTPIKSESSFMKIGSGSSSKDPSKPSKPAFTVKSIAGTWSDGKNEYVVTQKGNKIEICMKKTDEPGCYSFDGSYIPSANTFYATQVTTVSGLTFSGTVTNSAGTELDVSMQTFQYGHKISDIPLKWVKKD